jgi:predicted metal-dependent enzyme (double-stranded beta helix superfamily)
MRGSLDVRDAGAPVTDLPTFIAQVERLVATESDPHVITDGVRARLHQLVSHPDFLAPECREPDPTHYRTHLLAIAPSRKFSIVSLVWLPGQTTPIHDHFCWCVVGVLQGLESERRYHLRADATGARWLVDAGLERVMAGDTCALVPPDENIHQVSNCGEGVAISIHVYGGDLEVYKNSINQCFDDLPIREDDGSGEPVAWRFSRELA